VIVSTCDKLSIQLQMVTNSNSDKRSLIVNLIQDLQRLLKKLPVLVIEDGAVLTINSVIQETLLKVSSPNQQYSHRERSALSFASNELIKIQN